MPPEDAHPDRTTRNGQEPGQTKRARGQSEERERGEDQATTRPGRPKRSAAPPPSAEPGPSARFAGFRRPTANYVRCPNQYLDLCVPHCSLHVARLVGYMIRETIGWTKRNGEPRREKVSVTYNELVTHARVSRAKLRGALDEAIEMRFIRCVAPPRQQTAGTPARSGVYMLRWDESGALTRSLEEFRGFKFGGDCRTPLPNQFFDDVLRGEKHSVVRVVSAVLRHTVGYTNGITGERIEEAPLSYNRLLAFSPMDRKTLATALHDAEAAGYIRTVSAGRFSPDKRRQRAAVYAVRWDDESPTAPPADKREGGNGSPIPPEAMAANEPERFTDSTRGSATNGSRIPPGGRFTISTSNGSDSPPEERFTSSTTRKTPSQRQQQTAQAPAAAVLSVEETEVKRLVSLGFAVAVAQRLVAEHGAEEVRHQIEWLPRRNASRNVLGLLRRAIEEGWAEPRQKPPASPARSAGGNSSRAEDEAARRRARETHEHRRRPAYLAAVANIERAVRDRQPERYAAFADERAVRRERLAEEAAGYPPRVRRSVLAQFDSDEARLSDFAEAFGDEVPDFWEWDAEQRAEAGGRRGGS